MKRYSVPAVIFLLFVILVLVGISQFSNNRPTEQNIPSPTPIKSGPTPQNQPTTPSPVSNENPPPSPEQKANIVVTDPKINDRVGRTFIALGEGRVFENVVSYRLLNQNLKEIILQGTTMSNAPDVGQFGKFTITITIPESYKKLANGDPLTLEVYQASAKDGSDIDKVTIPLIFEVQ